LSENNDEIELELTGRLIELAKFIENNSSLIEEIKSELSQEDPIIKMWNKKLGDWELGLEKKFEKINKRFTTINDETGRITPEIEGLKDSISNQETLITTLEETVNNQAQQIISFEETINNLTKQISSLEETVNNQAQQISELIEVLTKQEKKRFPHTTKLLKTITLKSTLVS
jgi:chromosome segregation ATPase